MSDTAVQPGARGLSAHGHILLTALGLSVLALAVFLGWLVLRAGERADTGPTPNGGPMLLTAAQLVRFAAGSEGPVYWAGPRDGVSYEVTVARGGRTFVRYLPRGVDAGDPRANFLVVATYPGPTAFADLRHAAARDGAVSFPIEHHGLVVYSERDARNVYFGYPRRRFQVEVYAPSQLTPRTLVLDGKIAPVR